MSSRGATPAAAAGPSHPTETETESARANFASWVAASPFKKEAKSDCRPRLASSPSSSTRGAVSSPPQMREKKKAKIADSDGSAPEETCSSFEAKRSTSTKAKMNQNRKKGMKKKKARIVSELAPDDVLSSTPTEDVLSSSVPTEPPIRDTGGRSEEDEEALEASFRRLAAVLGRYYACTPEINTDYRSTENSVAANEEDAEDATRNSIGAERRDQAYHGNNEDDELLLMSHVDAVERAVHAMGGAERDRETALLQLLLRSQGNVATAEPQAAFPIAGAANGAEGTTTAASNGLSGPHHLHTVGTVTGAGAQPSLTLLPHHPVLTTTIPAVSVPFSMITPPSIIVPSVALMNNVSDSSHPLAVPPTQQQLLTITAGSLSPGSDAAIRSVIVVNANPAATVSAVLTGGSVPEARVVQALLVGENDGHTAGANAGAPNSSRSGGAVGNPSR